MHLPPSNLLPLVSREETSEQKEGHVTSLVGQVTQIKYLGLSPVRLDQSNQIKSSQAGRRKPPQG